MTKDEILIKNKELFIHDEFEDAVFKFTGIGLDIDCEVKFKGEDPYKIKSVSNIASEAYLGGLVITKEEYLSLL